VRLLGEGFDEANQFGVAGLPGAANVIEMKLRGHRCTLAARPFWGRRRAARIAPNGPSLGSWRDRLLHDLGHGRLSDPPAGDGHPARRNSDSRSWSSPPGRMTISGRSAGRNQPSLGSMASHALGRRYAAHGAEHQARPGPPGLLLIEEAEIF